MITLHNDYLNVQIKEQGAELHSIKRQGSTREYLWQGDPASWSRQAPILFPFVGRLKDDQYTFQGNTYHQTQHGFARDRQFTIAEQSPEAVTLFQTDDDNTHSVFPFAFKLTVTYRLEKDHLHLMYQVDNPDANQTLLYALGVHPGFNVPFTTNSTFETTQVKTDPAVTYHRIPLVGPYNDAAAKTSLDLHQPLKLNHELFAHDALIFDLQGQSMTVTLSDDHIIHGVQMVLPHNLYLGVWSSYPAKANFVCLEPWWGIADSIHSDGELTHKMSMHRLAPHASDHYELFIKPF